MSLVPDHTGTTSRSAGSGAEPITVMSSAPVHASTEMTDMLQRTLALAIPGGACGRLQDEVQRSDAGDDDDGYHDRDGCPE